MRLALRWRLVLSIGIPLAAVYLGLATLMLGALHSRSVERLEAAAVARTDGLARRLDDRVRLGGIAALRGAGLDDLDRQTAEFGDASFLVVGPDGRVLHASAHGGAEGQVLFDIVRGAGRPDLEPAIRSALGGARGVTRMEGLLAPGTRWVAYAPVASLGGAVFASAPESAVLATLRGWVVTGLAAFLAGIVALLAVVAVMSAHVTRPLSRLAGAVGRLGGGDLATRVEGIERGDEIGDLATAFNRMVGDLGRHVEALRREEALRESVEAELRAARRIQQALLPKSLPAGANFSLAARYLPARHVAGDFYDAFTADGQLVFLVADVAGKGLPSALYMAMSKTVLQREIIRGETLAQAVRSASDALEQEQVGAMYLTAFVGRFDPRTGSLRYVNAGHPPPWRLAPPGDPAPVGEATGPPVGLLPGRTFEERETALEPGSTLVVFSDGVPEARRADDEFYGDERLAALLARLPAGTAPDAACAGIAAAVQEFQGQTLADDVTVLALQRHE